MSKRITPVAALAIAVMAICGCSVRTQTQPEIPLSPVAKAIQARGYRAQKSYALPPTDWEISQFRLRNRVMVAFKAEQPLPNERETYYCRFSLAEESYDSSADAQQRLDHLHDATPNGPEEDEYSRVLRDGFVVDRTLYVLQTDAAKFLPEIRRLTKTLAASQSAR